MTLVVRGCVDVHRTDTASSSIILNVRGRILMSVEIFQEIMSQRILVGIILVGRLGVRWPLAGLAWGFSGMQGWRDRMEDALHEGYPHSSINFRFN